LYAPKTYVCFSVQAIISTIKEFTATATVDCHQKTWPMNWLRLHALKGHSRSFG